MSVGYLFVALITALLSSVAWFILGGSVVSGIIVYLIAGHVSMASLIALSAFRAHHFPKHR